MNHFNGHHFNTVKRCKFTIELHAVFNLTDTVMFGAALMHVNNAAADLRFLKGRCGRRENELDAVCTKALKRVIEANLQKEQIRKQLKGSEIDELEALLGA